ncbi:hypothetical protein C0389_01780 [bacterium]|nr:hypothetical protein [bacterium]
MKEKTKIELIKEIKRLSRENASLLKKIEGLSAGHPCSTNKTSFLSVFENAGLGITILTPEGKFQFVNSTFAKFLGYSKKELCNLSIQQISHPHDFDTSDKLFKDLVKGKRKHYQIEKRYISKQGHIKYGKLTVLLYEDEKSESKNIISLVEDITEQVEIAAKLAAEQNLFYTLLEHVPDKIYFKDLNSRFIKANRTCSLKHGFEKPEAIIGKTDADTFGPAHAAQAYMDEQNIIKTGIPIINKEEREDWPDGRITWASTSKMPLYDSNGNIIGTFGITRDITESKLHQEEIKESERLYRSLFDISDYGMFLTSEDLILDCNQTVLNIFKCEREFVVGHPPADFSPEFQPDGRSSAESSIEKIAAALNGNPQKFFWQHKRPDGSLVDCSISLKAVVIGGRKIIQATMRDITQRKRSEKIRQSLFEISEIAYTASDMDSMYKSIHKEIATLMNVKNIYLALYDDKTDMVSFPYFVDEYDPPQMSKRLGKGLTEYILRKGEAELIDAQQDLELRKAGEVELIGAPAAIWLGVPLKLAGKTIGVIVVQDYENEKAYGEEEKQILIFVSEQIAQVIERKRSSEAIKKYTEELKQLNATKDKFFSIIAHDLKNPFITLLGFSDLLISDFGEFTDEEKIYYITEMKKSAEISHNLLQNLLLWSRAQTGRVEFNPLKLDLHKIVSDNIELLNPTAERKQIKLTSDIVPNTFIFADEDMLNTIIRNLVTNAIKFTNKDGKIKINCVQRADDVMICISDNGVGMNDKVKANLFRLDVSQTTFGTDNEAGTGLGLILCKEFVEKHGHKIWVESEVGKGSKFIFTLPYSE